MLADVNHRLSLKKASCSLPLGGEEIGGGADLGGAGQRRLGRSDSYQTSMVIQVTA